ncbi:MAG TPA: GMC family oxidoreductase [Pirellulaceae bacterium]|nr:GMC family oxidoreductase [Pirellulaceae bacterium]HMO92010.1 GMC family oxidoreductase [Pirellulaceae bacterium]HMP68809.1 GMC family oxidoreductase [Pirellulaceae bacterium]
MNSDRNQDTESNTQCSRREALKKASSLLTILACSGGSQLASPQRACADGGYADVPAVKAVTRNSRLKEQARRDYAASMRPFGGRLSNTPDQLFAASLTQDHPHYDVVVVGSGYGASITAARLAARLRPGKKLAIIERGREWIPGDFPDTFQGLNAEARNQMLGNGKRTVVNPLGLYDVQMNDEVNILSGNGLGGTSLINASIALQPDLELFWQPRWPAAFRDPSVLNRYFRLAEYNLGLTLTPFDQTSKIISRRLAAENLAGARFELSPINTTYGAELDAYSRNRHGIIQRPCTLCGDCITGCNVGAKNTLVTSYLPLAKRCGAHIFTQIEVRAIEKLSNGLYRLHLVHYDDQNCDMQRRYTSITSRIVVLGAGSPGSVKVLLKSRERGLALSPALGHFWSANGDTIGFSINNPIKSEIGGFGAYDSHQSPVGPTVQCTVDYRHRPNFSERIIIQDAALPRAVTNLFSTLLRDRNLENSMVMLGMGHDGSNGRVILHDNRATVVWPGLRESAYRQMMFREFERLAAAHGGQYKRLRAFGDNLVTVHPLGGCSMNDDPLYGVVNHLGQVYDGAACGMVDSATGMPITHVGLYVADGSIMPTSLGVNPLMTISAISEYIADQIPANPNLADMFTV